MEDQKEQLQRELVAQRRVWEARRRRVMQALKSELLTGEELAAEIKALMGTKP